MIELQHCDLLIQNVNLATMNPAASVPYGQILNAAVAVTDGKISWLGCATQLPSLEAKQVVDGQQGWLTPGLIDCHTHLIYGGSRAREFEMRLQGYSYQAIAQQGGGIVSTVNATRAASEQALFESGLKRLQRLMAEGVTTVEIKSGYGLDWPTEQRMLKVAKQLSEHTGIEIKRTFLAAHAVPPEYKDRADDYLDLVIDVMLPQVAEHNLADAVDVFCEGIGFSHAKTERLFKAAQQYGLPVKGHMEQLSDLKGSRLAAEFGALSVDHLEYLAEEDLPALKAANTVAVLLPGAFYCLKETKLPPVQALFEHQIPVAVSTDLNPGTSPIASLRLAMNQSCVLFGLTPEQALAGATCHAAQALGLQAHKGQLQVGYQADLVLWPIEHPSELSYAINMHTPEQIWIKGQPRLNPSISNTIGA